MQERFVTRSVSVASPEATRTLGAQTARACGAGTVILLSGPLGAGKTTFVDGFASGLGAGRATSPTFVIAHSYPGGRLPMWHLDLYRLEDPAQIEELDLEQYISDAAVTLVEWPERAADLWPKPAVRVAFAITPDGRTLTFSLPASMHHFIQGLATVG